jgi:hypothetical protein
MYENSIMKLKIVKKKGEEGLKSEQQWGEFDHSLLYAYM